MLFQQGTLSIMPLQQGTLIFDNASSTGYIDFLFVFVALRPMSTAMVIAGRSVHLTTLFPGQA